MGETNTLPKPGSPVETSMMRLFDNVDRLERLLGIERKPEPADLPSVGKIEMWANAINDSNKRIENCLEELSKL